VCAGGWDCEPLRSIPVLLLDYPPVAYFPIFSNSDIDHPFVGERNEKAKKGAQDKGDHILF